MADPRWLEVYERELRSRALPAWYVSRLVEELNDHITDVKEKNAMEVHDENLRLEMGDPQVTARIAADEFGRRSYLGRHPGLFRRAVVGGLCAGLLTIGGLVAVPALVAGQYLIKAKVERGDGELIASPQMFVIGGKEATLSLGDGKTEYRMRVQTGTGRKPCHTVELRIVSADENGGKTTLAAPRMLVPTGGDCRAEFGPFKFSVNVDALNAKP